MSVLGVIWDPTHLYLSCHPDPANPARRLEELCCLDIPEPLGASIARRLSSAGTMTITPTSEQDYESFKSDFTLKFNELINIVNGNEDAQVLLMEPVDHIAFLAPPDVKPAAIRTYYDLTNGIGADVTIVAYPTAAIVGTLGHFEPDQPFLLCEWNQELRLSAAVLRQHPGYFSRTETQLRLKGVGPTAWEPLIERYLRTTYGIGYTEEEIAVSLAVKPQAFKSDVKALIQSMLEAHALPSRQIAGVNPSTQTRDELFCELSDADITQALAPVLRMAENFVSASIENFVHTGARIAVFSGPVLRLPSCAERLTNMLSGAGFEVASCNEPVLRSGLHACVRSRPQLPYDCGVLIKKSGAKNGFGTLILVRPTRIGQQRESEVFELRLSPSETLDLAFYVRRLMVEHGAVAYHVMQTHIFAPHVDDSGRVRLRVGMLVDADPDDESAVKVTIDLHDVNADAHIRFDQLPITEGEPMYQLPLRAVDELDGLEWIDKIDTVSNQLDTTGFSVAAWRQVLEDIGRGRVSRSNYASLILEIAGIESGMFVDQLEAEATDPEAFQVAGRQVLFWAMHSVADLVVNRYDNCRHSSDWIALYPSEQIAPEDERCAEIFVNALSQDLAGTPSVTDVMQRAKQLNEFYHHTCQAPHNLNIAW